MYVIQVAVQHKLADTPTANARYLMPHCEQLLAKKKTKVRLLTLHASLRPPPLTMICARRAGSVAQRLSTARCAQSHRVRAPRITPVRSCSRAYSSRPALTQWSPEEEQLRESVQRFAREVVQPKVKIMDERSELDKEVLKAMFGQGLMGVEIPTELGGAGMSFTSSVIAIEELAKIDPAVSVSTCLNFGHLTMALVSLDLSHGCSKHSCEYDHQEVGHSRATKGISSSSSDGNARIVLFV